MLIQEKYSDNEIIDGLRYRDNELLTYFYTRYSPMIRLLILRLGGTREDAEDIFQDGLIALTEVLEDRTFVIEHTLRTYFYQVCKFQWTSNLSKMSSAKNYQMRRLDDSIDHDFTDSFDNEACWEVFWETFNAMGKDCRTILKLAWRGMSLKEIADILGFEYGYLRNKKCECNKELTHKIKCHPTIQCMTRSKN